MDRLKYPTLNFLASCDPFMDNITGEIEPLLNLNPLRIARTQQLGIGKTCQRDQYRLLGPKNFVEKREFLGTIKKDPFKDTKRLRDFRSSSTLTVFCACRAFKSNGISLLSTAEYTKLQSLILPPNPARASSMTMRETKRHLLFILDLNGTLLHRITKASLQSLATQHPQCRPCDCTVNRNNIYYRPGHREFLSTLFKLGKVAVWTSAMPKNAIPMVVNLFGDLLDEEIIVGTQCPSAPSKPGTNRLLFLWTQHECDVKKIPSVCKPDFKKDLDKVWKQYPDFSAENTIMIDDSPLKLTSHQDNLIPLREFLVTDKSIDHTKDSELQHLGEYLAELFASSLPVPMYMQANPFQSELNDSEETTNEILESITQNLAKISVKSV